MLRCECDRCHEEMKVPLSATPFLMPDPNVSKPDFMIFQHTENNQMQQLHLCSACEKAFKSFLNQLVTMKNN